MIKGTDTKIIRILPASVTDIVYFIQNSIFYLFPRREIPSLIMDIPVLVNVEHNIKCDGQFPKGKNWPQGNLVPDLSVDGYCAKSALYRL